VANELAKYLNSRRRHKDETAVKKQLKIAKQHNSFADENKVLKEPHRLAKHHAMDCGNPKCFMCGNPRKTHKDKLTAQEKRIFQDAEKSTDRHSNGLKNDEEDIL
jgi:hypothetical protein